MTVKDIFEVKEAHLDAIRGMNDLIFFSENVLGFKNEPFHKTILEALSKKPRRLLILAFRGSGKCLKSNSLVTMADGSRKRIDAIAVGDMVIGLNNEGKLVPDIVLGIHFTQVRNGLTIILDSGRIIELSKKHRMLTFSGFKKARDIKIGDYLATPRLIYSSQAESVSDEEVIFIAHWLAEGAKSRAQITSFDTQTQEELKLISQKLNMPYNSHSDGTVFYFKTMGFDLIRRLGARKVIYSQHRHRKVSKCIPEIIFMSSLRQKALFLNRFYRGDGNLNKRSIELCQVDERLIRDIQELLLHLGIHSTLSLRDSYYTNKKTGTEKRIGPFKTWRLLISEKPSRKLFLDLIGNFGRVVSSDFLGGGDHSEYYPPDWKKFLSKPLSFFARHGLMIYPSNGLKTTRNKVELVNKLENNPSLTKLLASDLRWGRVIKIQDAGSFEAVDIQTSCGIFIANQMISHNSTIVETEYPLWNIINNRDIRILQVSHSVNQVSEFLRQAEMIMATHQRFRELYGNLIPDNKTLTWTDTEKVVLGRSGKASHVTLRALGAQAGILGRRADLVVVDDVVNLQNSTTEQQRKNLSTWFWQELLPVLEPDGCICVIGTRFAPGDLYEELTSKGWPVIMIPALSIVDGKEVATWPDRFSLEELKSRREAMGTIYFNLQYMNSTTDFSGNLLKRNWLKYTMDIPKKDLIIFFGVDPCITGRTDFLAIAVIGLDPSTKTAYFLDMLHTKAEIGREMELIKEYAAVWKPRVIGVEANAAQRMLADHLANTTLLPIKRVTTQRDKLSRFISMSVLFEAGRVLLKGQQSEEGIVPIASLEPFIEEWTGFPKSPHDDCLPAGTLIRTSRGMVPIEEVSEGDMVLTHLGRYRKVLRSGSRYADQVYEITSHGFLRLQLTGNHRFLASKKYRKYPRKENGRRTTQLHFSSPEWIKIDDGHSLSEWAVSYPVPREEQDVAQIDMSEFAPPSYIVTDDGRLQSWTYSHSRLNPKQNTLPKNIQVDRDFCMLLGYYAAEGSHGKHNISFASHSREISIREWLIGYLKKLGLNPCSIHDKPNGYVVSVGSIILRNFFAGIGSKTTKRLPSWTEKLPLDKQRAIIAGYLLGDACFTEGSMSVNSVSSTLTFQIYEMLLRQGWACSLNYYPNRIRWGSPQWVISTGVIIARQIKATIPELLLKDRIVKDRAIIEEHHYMQFKKGSLWGGIHKARPIEHNALVYNLEVEEDHSYVANGITVHNCLDAVAIALDLAMYFGPKAASAIVEPEPDPNRGRRFTPIFRHGRIGGGIRDDSIDSSEAVDKTPRPPKRGKVRGTPSSGS